MYLSLVTKSILEVRLNLHATSFDTHSKSETTAQNYGDEAQVGGENATQWIYFCGKTSQYLCTEIPTRFENLYHIEAWIQ